MDSFWYGVHSCNNSIWIDSNKLIRLYLEEYISKFDSFEPFTDYFEEDYLQKLYCKHLIYNGKLIFLFL